MAKQFGVSDAALKGLEDPSIHPFPAGERAALRFADAMTLGSGEVAEPVFQELARHYEEPQIVEIAAVVGLFNYFNRFNNALHVEITLMDPAVLVERVAQAARTEKDAGVLCDAVTGILQQGRRFALAAIYRRDGETLGREACRGSPVPPERIDIGAGSIGEAARSGTTRVENVGGGGTAGGAEAPVRGTRIAVPAAADGRIVAVIVVESERSPEALDTGEDRAVLERLAPILAARLAASA
ncbi:MAG: GAF domain-containing protein [Candidatus Polarisedimenticolia bacterium]